MITEINKAIEMAIKREDAAYELYAKLARKTANLNIQKTFQTLALQELKHKALLKEYMKTKDMIEAKDTIVRHYTDPDLEIADNLFPTIDINGLREEIQKAIRKERAARELYENLRDRSNDESVKAVSYTHLRAHET